VSWYRKGKINLDFAEARDGEWQWYQLGHMQVCTLLQTDNHTSTQFFQLDQDLQECERQSLLCLTANNHTSTQFFTGQMPFLLPNQQRQSISYSFNGAVYLQCICLQCFDTVGWSS